MSKIFNLIIISLFFSFLIGSCSKEIDKSRLQERSGLAFEVNSENPYSGKIVSFYNNGQKREEMIYKDGKLNDFCLKWHENGYKEFEGNYIEGNKNGLWITWHNNGQKKNEVNYLNDKMDGKWISWGENGEKNEEGNYKMGKKEGLWAISEFEITYKNGKKNGTFIQWLDSDRKIMEGKYKDGKEDGLWIFWSEEGNKEKEVWFKNGIDQSLKKDVVCGMFVNTSKSKIKADYKEKTYYFCSEGCKEKFESDPAIYVMELGKKK